MSDERTYVYLAATPSVCPDFLMAHKAMNKEMISFNMWKELSELVLHRRFC